MTNLLAKFDTGRLQHTVSAGVDITPRGVGRPTATARSTAATNSSIPTRAVRRRVSRSPTQRNDVKIDTVAAYAYDTIKLSQQWQMTGGLRVENYSVSIDSRTVAGASLAAARRLSRTSATTLGGKVGMVYKPVAERQHLRVVRRISPAAGLVSVQSGHLPHRRQRLPRLRRWAPTRCECYNYEIGTKWDFFNERLSTAVALFRTEKTQCADHRPRCRAMPPTA